MIADGVLALLTAMVDGLATAMDAVWPTLDTQPVVDAMGWFTRLGEWLPLSAFRAQLTVLVALVGFVLLFKFSMLVIHLVRG